MEDAQGPALADGVDKFIDQLIVGFAPLTGPVQAEVKRIETYFVIVGSYVEADREGHTGIDTGRSHVQAQFAYRDAHPVEAQITQSQDAFTIGEYDDANVLVGPIPQNLIHLSDIFQAYGQPPWPAEDTAELLTGQSYRGGVDDGHHLLEVTLQEVVKEGLIAVKQADEVDIFCQVRCLVTIIFVDPFQLLIDGHVPGRQQSPEAESVTLLRRESGSLIQPGIT